MGVAGGLLEELPARVGFGTAPLSIEGRPAADRALDVIVASVGAGIRLIDTADAYCVDSYREHGYGERLVAAALRRVEDRSSVLVASKVGGWRPGDGRWQHRGHPKYLKTACERSLRNLAVDEIDLLQLHRPDPVVPLEESVGELRRLMEEGKVLRIGLSNVTASELERALPIAPIASVQNPLSVVGPFDKKVVRLCEENRLALLAHSPFGGPGRARSLGWHRGLRRVAKRLEATSYQVANAWLLRQSSIIITIPGTTSIHRARENARAAGLALGNDEAWEELPSRM